MARTGITRDQVFEAADQLAAEGIQPTVKLVRERVGGSYSTITPHLATWKDERRGQAIANVPDMPESVATASRQVWVAAWKGAEDLIKTERDGLTAARREMESERAEMASEISDLDAKLETALSERDTLTSSLKDEREKLEEAQEELAHLRVDNARLEERTRNTDQRADELRAQVERLEGELARLAHDKEEQKEATKHKVWVPGKELGRKGMFSVKSGR
jgi:colicin import membrane protein